ncbi:hypothetical protein ACQPZF_26625 [Actinosynnema sp. CS-041913]|uniref:hypothetical protein n=1 Tax=Actinosynnema sp. CS-041913 TaxID=3239917 RepID=UPI003D8C8118
MIELFGCLPGPRDVIEGVVNEVEPLKRPTSGAASIALLRKRILLDQRHFANEQGFDLAPGPGWLITQPVP